MNNDNLIMLAIAAAVAYYFYSQSVSSSAATIDAATVLTAQYLNTGPNGAVATFYGDSATVATYAMCDPIHGYPTLPCQVQ